jgi:hypothetical protein
MEYLYKLCVLEDSRAGRQHPGAGPISSTSGVPEFSPPLLDGGRLADEADPLVLLTPTTRGRR